MSYSPFRHAGSILRKAGPIHLTLFLTGRCNANCPFCFYVSDKRSERFSSDELTLDELSRISRSVGNLLWLAFSGGEPFLRKDIVEITKVFYTNNRPCIILFPTNGLMPGPIKEKVEAVLRACPESTIVVKLSLDGPEELHDSIRGVKGSYKKVIESYNVLGTLLERYENFELGINTVFCSLNQDSVDSTIEFVKKLENIKTHTVSLIRGDLSDPAMKDVDTLRYCDTINRMAADLREKEAPVYRFRGAKIKAAQDVLQRRLIYRTIREKKQLIPCYAGRLNVVIGDSGDVYPCESFDKRIGNIKDYDYDLKKILKSPVAVSIIKSIGDDGCCCTHECYMMTNILFNPRMYPALFKEYLGIRDR